MKIKVVVYASILSSILLATGLVAAASYSNNGIEQAYLQLPGIPSSESPFTEFINTTTENDALYPSDYEVLSTNPFIVRFDYRYHSKIYEFQARRIAFEFLETILTPDVFDTISNGSAVHWVWKPHWLLQFSLNSTQDSNKRVSVIVGVNSISGAIIFYMGPLPESITLNLNDFNEVEAAKAIFEIFNTSIPSNSRYEQFSYDDSRFSIIFTQTVGPVVLGAIGGISINFFNTILGNSSSGLSCRYSMIWIPFSEIPIEHIRTPHSSEPVLRSLMLMPTSYDSGDLIGLRSIHDYRLCWQLSNSTDGLWLTMDAFSGEIVHYTYHNHIFGPIFTDIINPLLIPISGMVFASISYLVAKRKILKS